MTIKKMGNKDIGNKACKWVSSILTICMAISATGLGASAQSLEDENTSSIEVLSENSGSADTSDTGAAGYDLLSTIHDTIDYDSYISGYLDKGAGYPDKEIVVSGTDYKEADDTFCIESDGLCTMEEGSVTYEFEVTSEGFYNILLDYYPLEGKNNSIERIIYINGEIPFENAQYLEFTRVWSDAEDIVRDSRDNDVRPRQSECYMWRSCFLTDSDGYYQDPFYFYFKKGTNTITFESTKEPMKIGRITLMQAGKMCSYSEYLNNTGNKNTDSNNTNTNNTNNNITSSESIPIDIQIKVQGEDALYKSDSTLYPISDRTSPLSEPYSPSKTRLNEIGGNNWKKVGQWISWEIEVPQTGYYTLALRYRQNINTGVTVIRSLSIDGQVPFKEASELKFLYSNDWKMDRLSPMANADKDNPYLFYLEAGTHEIGLQITLGDELSEIIRRTDNCIAQLNRSYRQLLMIIGSSADTMRDYQLEQKAPEALKILSDEYEEIKEIRELLNAYTSGLGSSSFATIDNLQNQLEKMISDPRTIAKQWSAFKDNIVSLGSWELSMKEQPLEIDYLMLCSGDAELPKAEAGFWSKLVHEFRKFMASFVEDYDSIGEVYGGDSLEVWILADGSNVTSMTGGGRDQATIIKQLADNYFVPDTSIPVNIKLVNKDVLLSATLAGRGPDVALGVAGKEPINYALRNAVADLTQFDDFEDIRGWFHECAFEQFTFEGGVYALPQTMSFHVMFYRADILKELGLFVPNTWDEFYEALSVIQKSNMNVGIFPDYTTFAMFLYQHQGSYYTDDGMASGLGSEEAVDAFKQWSGNYVNYGMPVSFDFANRFRTGEMPLAIGDYTNYNYLSVFAPEIRGLWGFTVVPGYEVKTLDEGGNVVSTRLDRSVSSWESASIIMETSDHKDQAWEFLKWWMSSDTQSEYGNEIESVLGVSGRVATANLEALGSLPWSSRDYTQLLAQMQEVKAIPEIPGSYYTERNIKNAFYTVYNNNEDPRETLQDIVKTINSEIDAKREEFGLPLRNLRAGR
jgi:ABC-type glycerol-3-phosphate transport system substrate-binding protein